jgi:hypothetical protein
MNLDDESMERILIRVTEFDKAQCNNKHHMSIRFSTRTSYGFGRTMAYQRGALQRVFKIFQIKFPSTQALREKIISTNHISYINYLDEHEVPNNICSQASR